MTEIQYRLPSISTIERKEARLYIAGIILTLLIFLNTGLLFYVALTLPGAQDNKTVAVQAPK